MVFCKALRLSILLLFPFSWVLQAQDDGYRSDITVEKGVYIPLTNRYSVGSASITSISGSYFLDNGFGVRSGISYISELEGSDGYWKIPFLFCYKINLPCREWDELGDFEDFSELFIHTLSCILPASLELNTGFSLGGIKPYPSSVYTLHGEQEILIETYNVNRRFAASWDAELKFGFQIWRILLSADLGVNYLLSNNLEYTSLYPFEETYKPKWFGKVAFGVAYRF